MDYPILNKFQTPLDDKFFADMPDECIQQFWEFFNQVPLIQTMVSTSRKRACDIERDEKGRIIVDIVNPHILEDMDYFTPTANHYRKYGCYTFLKPNPNKNSEFGRWIREETRRCWNGYVRESDGEWITGYCYFYLNYARIELSKFDPKNPKKASRVEDFPKFWEGVYYMFHYYEQARFGGIYNNWEGGNFCAVLAKRGASKSYTMSSMLAHDFILGENEETKEGGVMGVNMAYSKEYLQGKDGCLNKFQKTIDWCADKMHWPSLRLTERPDDMIWVMGYRDKENGIIRGTQNTIVGVTIADKVGKARGKRAAHIFFEEFGSFPNLSKVFENTIPSVKDGDAVFGQIIMVGTAGDNASDFAGASDIMYHPEGSMMYGLPNVYDKIGTGKKKFVYFFPAYMSRTGCMDKDGNSDVTLALKKILLERFQAKYNSNDPDKIIKRMAENPIVPSEAIISMAYNMFPSVDCGNRIAQLDNNAGEYDDVLVGDLVIEKNGEVGFRPSNDQPIHIFPTKDNKVKGAIEIFAQPEINERTKKPFDNRYIAGVDPYDNDQAESMSLGSIFVLDLWTDKIVAEYTGRPEFANDFYEICRKLCLYYNARCNYENNKKGLFTYFSQMSSTYLLTDSLQCLRDKQMFKGNTVGNCAKGTVATPGVNDWARHLLRDWLLKPVVITRQNDDGTEREETIRNLYLVRNRALLQECAVYNSEGNFDRVSSMGMLMLLREDRMIAYGGDPSMDEVRKVRDERMDDPFFNKFDDEIDGDNFNPMDFSF